MTWTTGKMSCFALAMLEWLQAGRGRRGAAGWMALERQPRWWPKTQVWLFLPRLGVPSWPGFPASSAQCSPLWMGPVTAVVRVTAYGQGPAPVWWPHAVGLPQMRPLLFLTGCRGVRYLHGWWRRERRQRFTFPVGLCAHPVASLPLHSGAVSATPPSLLPLPKAVLISQTPGHLCHLAWPPRTAVPRGLGCPYISWNSQPPAAEFSRVPRSGFPASQAQPRFPVSQGIYNETPSNADPIHSLFCSLRLHVAVLLNAASRHWGYNFHQVDRVQTTCSTRLPSSVIPQQSTREGKSRDQDEVPAVCLSGAADALAPTEVIFPLFRATLRPQTPKRTFHFTCLSIKSFS